jgi:hypothetical protein
LYGNPAPAARLIKRFFLALLLVLAQHAAAMHALGHSAERPDDGQTVQSLHAGCLGLHGIDDAPAAGFAIAHSAPEFSAPLRELPPSRYAAPHQDRYHSRAPPANS